MEIIMLRTQRATEREREGERELREEPTEAKPGALPNVARRASGEKERGNWVQKEGGTLEAFEHSLHTHTRILSLSL